MKLVQLNIWQGRFTEQIKAFLAHEQPDIICLQEVYSSSLDTPLMPFFNALEQIHACVPDYHVFFSPVHKFSVLGEEVQYGNAILSRLPLSDTEVFFVNGEYTVVDIAAHMDSNIRNVQRATIQLENGKKLCLINHHGYWEPSAIGSDITIEKMQKVADIITSSPRPLLFAGDLQIISDSPAMNPIKAQLRDLTGEYKLATTLSSFGKVKGVACDHICVSEEIQVQSFEASEILVSDHLALVTEFDVA